MIGQSVGSYSIQRELGRGGMGAVYVGHHALLGRPAAIKVLLPDYSRNQEIVQRFFNEARAATAIRHPGIVEIYDFGFAPDGSAFIVMELCDGESLSARQKRGVMPVGAALGIARQVAGALGAAHKAGIVHRDLKPDNVFLVPDPEVAGGERIKLLDFGIAKLAGDASSPGMARTSTGAIMGTPYYMSPEQCRGAGAVDHRSDLYSLGCMLFEMVAGRVPFVGEGAGDIISSHILLPPPSARSLAPSVPAEVEQLIAWLLAKKPADRPQSADAVIVELQKLSGSSPSMAPSQVSHASLAHAPTMAPTAPTTLSASAGAAATVPESPKSKRGVWIALGGGALVAGGIAIAVAAGGGAAKHAETPAAVAPPDAAPVAVIAPTIDAAPAPLPVPTYAADAPTIVLGAMGGTAIQKSAASTFAKSAPDLRVIIDDGKSITTAGRAFYLDTSNSDDRSTGDSVKCTLDLILHTYPDKNIVATIHGSATVSNAQTASDIDAAKTDCEGAVVEDLIAKKVIGVIRDRLNPAPPPPPPPPPPAHEDDSKQRELANAKAKMTHLIAAHDCKSADQLATILRDHFGKDGEKIAALAQTCHMQRPEPIDEPAASGNATVEADVKTAYSSGQYGKVLQLCKQAGAPNVQVLTICGMAACNVKDTSRAKKYLDQVPANRQNVVRQVCLRNGVSLD